MSSVGMVLLGLVAVGAIVILGGLLWYAAVICMGAVVLPIAHVMAAIIRPVKARIAAQDDRASRHW